MLKDMGEEDYHEFRLPYWDWRFEMQKSSIGLPAEYLFTENKMGATTNINGFPRVTGRIFENWDTICWRLPGEVCDPRVSTGPLQRCPFTGTDPCNSDNPDWPTEEEVEYILSQEIYDAPAYNGLTFQGFRTFIDANISFDVDSCRTNRMCQCFPGGPFCLVEANPILSVDFKLHSAVRISCLYCCIITLSMLLFRSI